MTTDIRKRLGKIELFAWLGEDEMGSGVIGLKRGIVPTGDIPLVATQLSKVDKLQPNMERQAAQFGKKIYLCRFTFDSVVASTDAGQPPKAVN